MLPGSRALTVTIGIAEQVRHHPAQGEPEAPSRLEDDRSHPGRVTTCPERLASIDGSGWRTGSRGDGRLTKTVHSLHLPRCWPASWQAALFLGAATLILGLIVTVHPTSSVNVIAVLLGILIIL